VENILDKLIKEIKQKAKQFKEIRGLCETFSDEHICDLIDCSKCVLNKELETLKDSLKMLLKEAEVRDYE
jgi:hypothetical protein